MTASLLVERRGPVAELMLNRPERRNALSRELVQALLDAADEVSADPEIRVIVLSGAPPAFCSGLDLTEFAMEQKHQAGYHTGELLRLYERLHCGKVMVAAVNGAAAAGGAGLVTVSDIAVAGESARLGYPGIRLGIVAPVVLPFLGRCVGWRWARRLLLTGEMISAQQAARIGLVHEVVSDEAVLLRARELAELVAECPPDAVRAAKGCARWFDGTESDLPRTLRKLCQTTLPLGQEGVERLAEFDTGDDCTEPPPPL